MLSSLALLIYDKHADWLPSPLQDWVGFIHGKAKTNTQQYDLCLMPGGILLLLFTGWYMGYGIWQRNRFKKFMETESKSEFLENLDEVEKLAWDISSKAEMLVVEKKETEITALFAGAGALLALLGAGLSVWWFGRVT